MIELTIDNKIYEHPSKIEEVTLKQWIAIKSVEQNEDATPLESNIKAFSKFSGIPVKVLKGVNKTTLMYHIYLVTEILSDMKEDNSLPKSFKVGRETYLVPKSIDDCDMAQYIDCTHYMNSMQSSPEFYPYMLAIYCLKKGEKYGRFDLDKRAKWMLKANVLDALRVNAFFLTTSKDYLSDFQRYLEAK